MEFRAIDLIGLRTAYIPGFSDIPGCVDKVGERMEGKGRIMCFIIAF
jgi:hypothetical protein